MCHADGETILEARLFDVEVLLQEVALFLQRDDGLAAAIEGDAQQIAQAADHAIGRLGIAVHERRDRVQRVEEEVRVQLRLQRLQPRLDDLRFELRRAHLPLLRLVVEGDRVADADDHRVDHQAPVELLEGDPLEVLRPRRPRPLAGVLPAG